MSKNVKWLYEQLPILVEKKIIPAESIDLIRGYYGPVSKNQSNRTMLTMFGIIGVILIGLGIILILAHNWEQLSRMTRTLIIAGNLLAAQIAAGAAIWFKKDNAAWAESTSTYLMIAIGASLAVIGQMYNIGGDFSGFMLTWMLLSLPIVYVMKVTTPCVLYVIGVTIWTVSGGVVGIEKHLIWILFALSGPHYRNVLGKGSYTNPSVIFSWVLILCLVVCIGKVLLIQYLTMLIYACLFAVFYFIGILWFDDTAKAWKNPFQTIGLAGGIGISFMLTSQSVWKSIGWGLNHVEKSEYLLLFLLLAFVLILSVVLVNKKGSRNLLLGAVPMMVGLGYLLVHFDLSGVNAAVLMNGYVLLVSVALIRRGVREERLGVLNVGMLQVAALIVIRFFDSDISFVVRGLIFVVMGICFLTANWVMVRRKKEVTK